MEDIIQLAASVIRDADTIFISAGAGIGVDSGLPDFRGDEGFWKAYPLLKEENVSFMDLADPFWFFDEPERAWGFYGHRFNLYRDTKPHEGFQLLKKWAESKKFPYFIFTSNVDGHFQKSGFSSKNIYECHGSINHLQCRDDCKKTIWLAEELDLVIDQAKLRATSKLPRCANCGAIARPNILMFGDHDWNNGRSYEQSLRCKDWKSKYSSKRIAIIELGAGKAIPTVRDASESISGTLIRINPRDSDGPINTISIPLGSLEVLEAIDKVL